MTQQLIRMPKPVGKSSQHFQRDIGAAPHEREKMLARQDSQRCVFHYYRVCRALTVEQRHFPKEISAPQLGQRHLVAVPSSHANADFPALDNIHCVAFVAGAEQECAGFAIEAVQQVT